MNQDERIAALEKRIEALERDGLKDMRLGPRPGDKWDREMDHQREKMVKDIVAKVEEDRAKRESPPPVDRTCQMLTDGSAVPEDRSHTEDRGDGQQKGYVVLCDTERAKGFVRPYRDAYKHLKCGKITTMGRKIAETYARDPFFYSGTFCVTCGGHFPIGEDGEFVWYEMDGGLGPKVGT